MLKNKEKIYPKNKDFVINAWDYRRMTAHKYKRIWQNCKPLWEKCFNCIQYILSYFLFLFSKILFCQTNCVIPNRFVALFWSLLFCTKSEMVCCWRMQIGTFQGCVLMILYYFFYKRQLKELLNDWIRYVRNITNK